MASEGIASQHRLEDQAYRDALVAKCCAPRSKFLSCRLLTLQGAWL